MKIFHTGFEHFEFFRNKEVDALHFTLSIIEFATGLAGIFIPIYLWELGEPLWRILFFYLLLSLFFVLGALVFMPVIRRFDDKLLMLASIPFISIYFFGLKFLPQIPFLFYVLPIFSAFSSLFFNTGYHIDFSGAADGDALGREIGARYMITSLVRLGAPFLGGFIIATAGFSKVFTLSTGLLLLSVLPLFFFKRHPVSPDVSIRSVWFYLKHKELAPFTVSGAGHAMEVMVGAVVWPIFMFVVLGSIEKLGGIISAGLLGGAVITFIIGFVADAGRRRRVITWSGLIIVAVWFLKIFSRTPLTVALNQITNHTAGSSLMVAWSSQYYKLARTLPSASSFILSRELLYNIARVPFFAVLMFLSIHLEHNVFFYTSFILAGLISFLYLAANLTHTTAVKEVFKDARTS